MSSDRSRVLVIVLAGGAGGRLEPLTAQRAKPAVPFAGMYRLIDVALSNVTHSGLADVWVIEQYEPHSLNDHLANGRPWDLDRTHGGLRILPPFQNGASASATDGEGDGDNGFAAGNADALVQNRHMIENFAADVVVTMSADHLYRLDLRDVLDTHRRCGATMTAVTTDPPPNDDPTRFAWVRLADGGAVTDFEYKPDHPSGDRVCTEVFAFAGRELDRRLADLDGDDSAGDYGDRLVPELVAAGGVYAHELKGYWRDVGTIHAYHEAHMELLSAEPPLRLDDPDWPLLTGSIIGGPARVAAGSQVTESLLSPGANVSGSVDHCVLGRNVIIESGATVRSSVILDDAVVRAGAVVDNAIVDIGTTVEADTVGTRDEGSGVVIYSAPNASALDPSSA